jgi:hypothetical protein
MMKFDLRLGDRCRTGECRDSHRVIVMSNTETGGHAGCRLDVVEPFVFVPTFELGRAGSPRFTAASWSAIDRR